MKMMHVSLVLALLPFALCVQVWQTTLDQQSLKQRLGDLTPTSGNPNNNIQVNINSDTYQEIYGYGGALTEAAAVMFMRLKNEDQSNYFNVLNAMFNSTGGAGFTMLRIPMGSCDMSESPYFTYDDQPYDELFKQWSWGRDTENIMPVLKDILSINPDIKIMITPWTAPLWMKNSYSAGNGWYWGILLDNMYDDFAYYFQVTIQQYAAEGIHIYAMSFQNEPQNEPNTYPVMRLTGANESALAIALGPKFAANNIDTKILVWDHNWDDYEFPMEALSNSDAYPYIAGSAFHCYGGDVSSQTTVYNAYPDKEIWFTECSGTLDQSDWSTNMQYNFNNLYLGAPQNWARTVLHWCLALDPNGNPHTGGCPNCRGVITVESDNYTVTYNEEYYGMAMVSSFLNYPAYRLDCNLVGGWGCMNAMCIQNGDNSTVVVVTNFCQTPQYTVIQNGDSYVDLTVNVGITTLVW